jgi:hypothetical protein
MKRPPYAERPEIIERWCSCERHDDGTRTLNPDCKLHATGHELPEGI